MNLFLAPVVLAFVRGTHLPQDAPPAVPSPAPGGQVDDLAKKLEAKLNEKFLKNAEWVTDYDAALAKAKESKKLIFGYFSRSYAPCPPCHALEEGALSTPEFKEWSRAVVPFFHITTRIPGRKHDEMLTKVGGQGFPHLVVMDSDGEVLATHEADREVKAFGDTLTKATENSTLKARALAGDATAKVEWLCRQLEGGMIKFADAQTRVKGLGALTPEQKTRVDLAMFEIEVGNKLEEIQMNATSQEDFETKFAAFGKTAAAWRKENKIPKGDQNFGMFHDAIRLYAEKEKNYELYMSAVKALKDRFLAKNPSAAPFFEEMEKRGEELKKAAAPEPPKAK